MRTPLSDHERLSSFALERKLPPLPYRPVVGECCGRGCDPCVWDYYENAMARWRERHAEVLEEAAEPGAAA